MLREHSPSLDTATDVARPGGEPGDAFYFRVDIIHRFENAGAEARIDLAVLDDAPRG